MKLSVLTMITKPDERQDKWREALQNYLSFADEVVCVNGGPALEYPGVKMVELEWKDNWEMQKLPHQLNFGKHHCTGDFILKLDIDMMLRKVDADALLEFLNDPMNTVGYDLFTLEKFNYVAGLHYYPTGKMPILFRNAPEILFGYIPELPEGDLCMPMKVMGISKQFGIPEGVRIPSRDTGCGYWNFSYTFKTKEIAKPYYGRMAEAYRKFYGGDRFGKTEDDAWDSFMKDLLLKVSRAKYWIDVEQLPEQIQESIKNLTPEQKGYDAWGLMKL